MKVKVTLGNSSVVKIYIIRPKPGPVAKNATPRPSGVVKIYIIRSKGLPAGNGTRVL